MKNCDQRLLLAFGLLCFLAHHASGQISPVRFNCLDIVVVNSEKVVVGKIVGFTKINRNDGSTILSIAVEETLKGKHQPRMDVRVYERPDKLLLWKTKQSRLLVSRPKGPDPEPKPVSAWTRVFDLDDVETAVLTADGILNENFKLLHDGDEVVRTAKILIKKMPDVRISGVKLFVPWDVVLKGNLPHGHGAYVYVPVDERLEKWAHKFMHSGPQRFEYLYGELYIRRRESAEALHHFKSPENIKRMQVLIKDPGFVTLREPVNQNGLWVRHYGTRKQAYETLLHWGVQVEKPIIRDAVWDLKGAGKSNLTQDVIAAHLKDLKNLDGLEQLTISGIPITDTDLIMLSHLKDLEMLKLSDTKVTESGLAAFRKRAPDLLLK